jgi:hypothetical protein
MEKQVLSAADIKKLKAQKLKTIKDNQIVIK